MSNQRVDSVYKCARRDFVGRDFWAGMAKDQLIFVIICSAALLVAAIALVHRPNFVWMHQSRLRLSIASKTLLVKSMLLPKNPESKLPVGAHTENM